MTPDEQNEAREALRRDGLLPTVEECAELFRRGKAKPRHDGAGTCACIRQPLGHGGLAATEGPLPEVEKPCVRFARSPEHSETPNAWRIDEVRAALNTLPRLIVAASNTWSRWQTFEKPPEAPKKRVRSDGSDIREEAMDPERVTYIGDATQTAGTRLHDLWCIYIDLKSALESLPRAGRMRELAILHFATGMTVREVADHTGESRGTVHNRIAKAREIIIDQLTEYSWTKSASQASVFMEGTCDRSQDDWRED